MWRASHDKNIHRVIKVIKININVAISTKFCNIKMANITKKSEEQKRCVH